MSPPPTTAILRKRILLAQLEGRAAGSSTGEHLAEWCREEGASWVTANTETRQAAAAIRALLEPTPLTPGLPAVFTATSSAEVHVPQVATVRILPTRVWVENDFFGGRHVMLQHEGLEPFTYASFHYDWRYTSNSGTWDAACRLAASLGAQEPVESRMRELSMNPTWQAANWLQDVWLRIESRIRRLLWPTRDKKA